MLRGVREGTRRPLVTKDAFDDQRLFGELKMLLVTDDYRVLENFLRW